MDQRAPGSSWANLAYLEVSGAEDLIYVLGDELELLLGRAAGGGPSERGRSVAETKTRPNAADKPAAYSTLKLIQPDTYRVLADMVGDTDRTETRLGAEACPRLGALWTARSRLRRVNHARPGPQLVRAGRPIHPAGGPRIVNGSVLTHICIFMSEAGLRQARNTGDRAPGPGATGASAVHPCLAATAPCDLPPPPNAAPHSSRSSRSANSKQVAPSSKPSRLFQHVKLSKRPPGE
jgi:hypothetical protein